MDDIFGGTKRGLKYVILNGVRLEGEFSGFNLSLLEDVRLHTCNGFNRFDGNTFPNLRYLTIFNSDFSSFENNNLKSLISL